MYVARRFARHSSPQYAASARLINDLCGDPHGAPAFWHNGHQSFGSMKSPQFAQ